MTTPMRGPILHRRSDDGLDLIIEEVREDGVYTTTVTWVSRLEADKNVESALQHYRDRELGNTLTEPGQKMYVKHLFSHLYLDVLTGPPTWWTPRFHIRRKSGRGLMVGWFRLAIVLTWIPPQRGNRESGPRVTWLST